MTLIETIKRLIEHKSNLEPLKIELDFRGNIYDINQLKEDGEDTLSSMLGLDFTQEQIIGVERDYPISLVQLLKQKTLNYLSDGPDEPQQQLIQCVGDLINYDKPFEIHPDSEGNNDKFSEPKKELHLHFCGLAGRIRDEQSGTKNYSVIITDQTDITYFKRLSEYRNQQLERLAKMGEMAAKVAHDILVPLTAIGGFANKLEKKLDGRFQEYASIIKTEVQRLESHLKDMLSFSGKQKLDMTYFDLNPLIEKIYIQSTMLAKKKNEEGDYTSGLPSIDLDLERGIKIESDFDKMYGIVLNLVSNSLDKEDVTKVEIKTYTHNDLAHIMVGDNGQEMSEETRENLFEAFYTTKKKGTGLGLPIAHSLIEQMGGKIKFESEKGRTAFYISLPLQKR